MLHITLLELVCVELWASVSSGWLLAGHLAGCLAGHLAGCLAGHASCVTWYSSFQGLV